MIEENATVEISVYGIELVFSDDGIFDHYEVDGDRDELDFEDE